jgi:hypothetical protein
MSCLYRRTAKQSHQTRTPHGAQRQLATEVQENRALTRANCRTEDAVTSRAFFLFFPCNHIINIKKYFSFSGEVKDSVNFLFFFYFTRELNLTRDTPPLLLETDVG